ncbi:unnamed protein product, partial [marine sediment metagenome]
MAKYEHKERRHKHAFLGRTRWYRYATCPWAVVETELPVLGAAMPAAWGGSTDAILLDKRPKPDEASGAALVALVFERLDPGIDPGLAIPGTWTLLRKEGGYSDERHGWHNRCAFEVP